MKIQCSCGAKYSFEVTPDMAQKPAHFVCPACGLDASAYLNELVRRELGIAAAPKPFGAASQGGISPAGDASAPPEDTARAGFPPPGATPAATGLRVRVHVPVTVASAAPEASETEGQPCPRHPTEWATEKCYVCSKPICPRCMELFGYLCSPLCRAKANSHGIEVPVYEGQQSVVEARQWRATVWVGTALAAMVAAALGFWIWYT